MDVNQPEFDLQDLKYTQCVEFGGVQKGPLGTSASYNYPETPSMFASIVVKYVFVCPL